jgi:hypothetical protein
MISTILINMLWGAALMWLANNPQHPDWWDVSRMVLALGGLPDL